MILRLANAEDKKKIKEITTKLSQLLKKAIFSIQKKTCKTICFNR